MKAKQVGTFLLITGIVYELANVYTKAKSIKDGTAYENTQPFGPMINGLDALNPLSNTLDIGLIILAIGAWLRFAPLGK